MASPPIFPCRNPSVFYSPVQMPLLLGSPLPFSLHILVRGQKKTPIHLLFGLLPWLLWNTFSHKHGGHSYLSEDLSSPTHPLPYFLVKWGSIILGGQGWARLVQKGNGLTLEGVFQDGKINCSSCCFHKEGPASHSCIALFPLPKGQKLWE